MAGRYLGGTSDCTTNARRAVCTIEREPCLIASPDVRCAPDVTLTKARQVVLQRLACAGWHDWLRRVLSPTPNCSARSLSPGFCEKAQLPVSAVSGRIVDLSLACLTKTRVFGSKLLSEEGKNRIEAVVPTLHMYSGSRPTPRPSEEFGPRQKLWTLWAGRRNLEATCSAQKVRICQVHRCDQAPFDLESRVWPNHCRWMLRHSTWQLHWSCSCLKSYAGLWKGGLVVWLVGICTIGL